MDKQERGEFMKALAAENDFDELESDLGTRENPYISAPEDWRPKGLPYGAYCKCNGCGVVERSTLVFDFYAQEVEDRLRCEDCNMNEKVRN